MPLLFPGLSLVVPVPVPVRHVLGLKLELYRCKGRTSGQHRGHVRITRTRRVRRPVRPGNSRGSNSEDVGRGGVLHNGLTDGLREGLRNSVKHIRASNDTGSSWRGKRLHPV